jgi:cupin fold WbuC family metalloprotein
MKVIDATLLDKVSEHAKESPRLRMNYNFHQSLEDKCHRFLNAVEPGTVVSIHRHPTKDESFVILRGKVRVTTHNDDGSIIEDVVLSQESGNYGVDIPKNVWHTIQCIEPAMLCECKEGPFVPQRRPQEKKQLWQVTRKQLNVEENVVRRFSTFLKTMSLEESMTTDT